MKTKNLKNIQDFLFKELKIFIEQNSDWKNLQTYITVPKNATLPYIKFNNIEFIQEPFIGSDFNELKFNLSILQEERSNDNIINLIDILTTDFIKSVLESKNRNIIVKNFTAEKYSTEENLNRETWGANISFTIIAKSFIPEKIKKTKTKRGKKSH